MKLLELRHRAMVVVVAELAVSTDVLRMSFQEVLAVLRAETPAWPPVGECHVGRGP